MKKYYIGLDIGTESVGWAVTDESYHLEKKNQKALWGVRLFDEAQKAEERRQHRIARRRLERRKGRLELLELLFQEEIAKVDPGFFQRMRESCFLEEDKRGAAGRFSLFADPSYTDAQYHKEFPTIYHLREALLSRPGPFDVRLVYLAVHHIVKYRGHFLYSGMNIEDLTAAGRPGEDDLFEACLKELNAALELQYGERFFPENGADAEAFRAALLDTTQEKSVRKQRLGECAQSASSVCRTLTDLLAGEQVAAKGLYEKDDCPLGEKEGKEKFSLKDDAEELQAKVGELLDDRMEVVLAAKALYDCARLLELCGGEAYLSSAMVKRYEKHKQDLQRLKRTVKAHNDRALYREIFQTKNEKLCNYVTYCGKGASGKTCTYEEFQKYLTKKLEKYEQDDPETGRICAELKNGSFLPKQRVKDNGVIPYQLHGKELADILERAAAYLPFLLEKDASGRSRKEQILELFRFRIPYYVGPLHPGAKTGWAVRRQGFEQTKITPWNFEEAFDLAASAEAFITRMTAKCTYTGEDVLPRDSLLYSRFMVLNELNNLTIDGTPITVELKQKIYQDLFLREGRKVTGKKLRNYLVSIGEAAKDSVIGGIDGDCKATLSSERVFRRILERTGDRAMVEDIIRDGTLFGGEKNLFKSRLKEKYSDRLTEEDISYVLRQKFSGWGRLSKMLLDDHEIAQVDEQTGELRTVIDMLWETNCNLMELLSAKYQFAGKLQAYREKKMKDLRGREGLEEYLKERYASPGIKRAIHQTVGIVDEIIKIMGGPPARIFIEMARENLKEEQKKRTTSRKEQLKALYAAAKKTAREWEKQISKQETADLAAQLETKEEADLRQKKLYLYYTQMGRCLYSGERIELSELFDRNKYDIDHIYPRSRTKDDSLHNYALVKQGLNREKGDTYPLQDGIRQNMGEFWRMLCKRGFLSQEKYRRLTRATPLTDEELAGFINRQLVETRQSSKIVAELFQQRYGTSSEIVYVKAGNVSEFRTEQRVGESGAQLQSWECKKEQQTAPDPLFVKCRDVNDLHHAKDAYLNIVVGNVYHCRFTKNPALFIKNNRDKDGRVQYNLTTLYKFDVKDQGETLAWDAGQGKTEGSIAVVRRTMAKNNVLFTRMPTEAHGKFFDVQIVPAGQGQLPIKTSDERFLRQMDPAGQGKEKKAFRYGGYNSVKGAYFCLVESKTTERTKKGQSEKCVRSIQPVYGMYRELFERDPQAYLQNVLELEGETRVLLPKIRFNSLLEIDGSRAHLTGRSGGRLLVNNANQLILSPQKQAYLKRVSKCLERAKNEKKEVRVYPFDQLTAEQNLALFDELAEKMGKPPFDGLRKNLGTQVSQGREKFVQLTLEDQCRVLGQLLLLFRCASSRVDLSLVGGASNAGVKRISQMVDPTKAKLCLVHQSITGVYEQVADLATVGGKP